MKIFVRSIKNGHENQDRISFIAIFIAQSLPFPSRTIQDSEIAEVGNKKNVEKPTDSLVNAIKPQRKIILCPFVKNEVNLP